MTVANPVHPWLAAILRAHLDGIRARDKRKGNGGQRSAAGRSGRRRLRELGIVFNGSAQVGARPGGLDRIPKADRAAAMRQRNLTRRCGVCGITFPVVAAHSTRRLCAECFAERNRLRSQQRYKLQKSQKEQQQNP